MAINKKFIPQCLIYHNEVNRLDFSMLTPLENNLLFSIFKDLNSNSFHSFDKATLIRMAYPDDITPNNTKQARANITKVVEGLLDKFIQLHFKIIQNSYTITATLFSYIKAHKDEEGDIYRLDLALNKDLHWIFMDLQRHFTLIDLAVFKSLRSNYSKAIYRLLCQYNATGVYSIGLQDFKNTLNIPNSYNITNIQNLILDKAITDLAPHFKNLRYTLNKQNLQFKWVSKPKRKSTDKDSLLIQKDVRNINSLEHGLKTSLSYARALQEDEKIYLIQHTISCLNSVKNVV